MRAVACYMPRVVGVGLDGSVPLPPDESPVTAGTSIAASDAQSMPLDEHRTSTERPSMTTTDDPTAKNRSEDRAERAERMARDGAQAMADHKAQAKAVDDRTVRLRAMRLAKEAEEAARAPEPAPKPKRKRAVKA